MPGLVNTGNNQHQSSDNHDGSTLLRICVGEKVVPSPLLESKKNAFFVEIRCIHFTVVWISHKNINPLVG